MFNMSEKIDQLASALAAAQGELKPVKEESDNGAFTDATYANLPQCWEAARDILSKNGLSVSHSIGPVHLIDKYLFQEVSTILMHKSGQWISGTGGTFITKATAHGQASAVTYAKRYGLCAIISLVTQAELDDDGNIASGIEPEEPKSQQSAAKKHQNNAKKTAQTAKTMDEVVHCFRDAEGRAFLHANGKDTAVEVMNREQLQFVMRYKDLEAIHPDAIKRLQEIDPDMEEIDAMFEKSLQKDKK